MNVRIILSTFFFTLSTAVFAQEYNFKDENGLKQGAWRKFHVDSENIFYKGQFKDDKPYGEFIYYYRDGKVKGYMRYDNAGVICRSEAFHPNGALMATGKYINQEKDSTWQYYTMSKLHKSTENWKAGVKHGEEITYYADGNVLELITWSEGKREGKWEQYFEGNKPKIVGEYLEDEYEGNMIFYYPNGQIEVEGKYVNGLRDGSWYYYNEDGSINTQTLYSSGKVLREKKETGVFSEHTPDGILLSEFTYKNGEKQGPFKIYHEGAEWVVEETFDEQIGEKYKKQVLKGHNLKMSGKYKNDKLHGTVKHYNSNGKKVREEEYVDGVLQ